ncbi:MAG: hypothetical protein ACK4NF_07370 [Planctomycetota bacterium]
MDIHGKEFTYDLVDDYILSKALEIISQNISVSKEDLGLVNKELKIQKSVKAFSSSKPEAKETIK